jgi:hypothetical protein
MPLPDPHFRVEVLNRTEHPQTLCWWAMHQDYSEHFVFASLPPPSATAKTPILPVSPEID